MRAALRSTRQVSLLFVLILLLVTQPSRAQDPPEDQQPAQTTETEEIHLEKSFEVPHDDGVRASHSPCVVFTPDGLRMLTVTSTGELIEFDRNSQKISKQFALPEGVTSAVAIDANGRFAVAALKPGIVVLEIASGKVIQRDDKLNVTWLAIAPNGSQVALSNGNHLEIRSIPTLRVELEVPGHQADITNVAWSADGRLVGSTAMDGHLIVYDVASKTPVYDVAKGEALHALAFHPQRQCVAYGGNDRQVYEFDFSTETEAVISQNQPYWITCLGYSPDGEIIAVGDESCDIWLYQRANKEMVFHNKHHVECWLNSVAWAPDNETFLFGCRPNSHAGEPSVYQPLAFAEAVQGEEVCKHRDALIAGLDAQLKNEQNEETKKALHAYRERLAGQGQRLNFAAKGNDGQQAAAADLQLAGADFGAIIEQDGPVPFALNGAEAIGGGLPTRALQTSDVPVDQLAPDVQELQKKYEEALTSEVKRLNDNHCIHQWRFKR